jgi:transcriptional regulator with XRE-family HTH domain
VAKRHAETFRERLRRALDEEGISVRALARRMAKMLGTELEQERRRLNRYLGVRSMVPTAESRALIEACLGLPAGTLASDEEEADPDPFRNGPVPDVPGRARQGRRPGAPKPGVTA